MTDTEHTSQRVVVVGGGFSGLATAVRLSQAGIPVSLFEASKLGFAASTRNQGWLYSGAIFAQEHPELARMCYQSLEETIRFCPDSLEPQHDGMIYLISKPDTPAAKWTDAWSQIGIPWQEYELEKLFDEFPKLARENVQHAFLLPDRSMRPDILLAHLAAVAENAGTEIRTETSITEIIQKEGRITGVKTSTGEEISARMVVLAGGTSGLELHSGLSSTNVGCQEDSTLVPLKSHLVALKPELGRWPLCVIDEGCFNHLPHAPTSVFGSNVWTPVADPHDQQPDPDAVEQLWKQVDHFFPGLDRNQYEVLEWAGTTIQAMHTEQVIPGQIPLPTVIDHNQESPGIRNFISLYPGRATLWSQVAEEACWLVLEKLEHAPAETASPPWVQK